MAKKWIILGPLVATSGGLAGLVGSAIQEVLNNDLLGPFVAGPIIEETLKPSGLYLLLAKRPQALYGRVYTALLSALSGLTFGIIENLIYLNVYFPQHSQRLFIVRYTAGLALHMSASFIVGLGINQKLIAAAKGEIPLFSFDKLYFVAGIALHSFYNISAVVFGQYLN